MVFMRSSEACARDTGCVQSEQVHSKAQKLFVAARRSPRLCRGSISFYSQHTTTVLGGLETEVYVGQAFLQLIVISSPA
jgi:hypothetical protein